MQRPADNTASTVWVTVRWILIGGLALQIISAAVVVVQMYRSSGESASTNLRLLGRRAAQEQQSPLEPGVTAGTQDGAGCRLNVTALREEVERVVNAPDIQERLAWAHLDNKESRGKGDDSETATTLLAQAARSYSSPAGNPSVPLPTDVLAELGAFYSEMLGSISYNLSADQPITAVATSAQLGLWPADAMNDLDSLPLRIRFANWLAGQVEGPGLPSRVAICTTWAGDVWRLRRELLPWVQYHTQLGVSRFYILYDGTDEEVIAYLRELHNVRLMFISTPFASAAEVARFEAWSATQNVWGGRPGNYKLMVKQGYGMTEALTWAKTENMQWLLHIDPDELIHPGNPGFSLAAELAAQPPSVSSLRFMNNEGQPEAADIVNRYEQVTLFRDHRHFITPQVNQVRQMFKLGGNRAFLNMYANGKSAVRVDAPGVYQSGPHFFRGQQSTRWRSKDNPSGQWRDVVSPTTLLLHYAYCQEQDVAARAARSCSPEAAAAAQNGNMSKVDECFVIDFDRDAFLAASSPDPAAASRFYLQRMVLTQGSLLRCENSGQEGWCRVHDVERLKALLLRAGLYLRLPTPRAILQGHERLVALLASMPATWGTKQGLTLAPVHQAIADAPQLTT